MKGMSRMSRSVVTISIVLMMQNHRDDILKKSPVCHHFIGDAEVVVSRILSLTSKED